MDLVGLHFMKGDFSLYLWGQNYHAAVEPLLMAPLFKIFGATPSVAALVPAFFSVVFIALYYLYLRKVCDAWTASISVLLLALPSPFFMSIASRNGDYVEILCLGMLHLLLIQKIVEGQRSKLVFFLLGLTAGFSWFYLRMVLIFWLAILIYLLALKLDRKRFESAMQFFRQMTPSIFWNNFVLLKGCSPHPWLAKPLVLLNLYNLGNFLLATALWFHGPYIRMIGNTKLSLDSWPLLESTIKMTFASVILVFWKEVAEKAVAFARHPVKQKLLAGFFAGYSPALLGMAWGYFPETRNGIANASELFRNFKLVSASFVPTLTGEGRIYFLSNFSMVLAAVAIACIFRTFYSIIRNKVTKDQEIPAYFPILCVGVVTFLLGITYDRLIDSSTLRYFFPFFICLPLAISWILKRVAAVSRWFAYGMLLLYLANSVDANILTLKRHESPSPYQILSQQLTERGIQGGYSDYWIAYYLTFISQEKIVVVSTEVKDRYLPHLKFVQSLTQLVYLGEPQPEVGGSVLIKGTAYLVVDRERIADIPVAYLKKF